MFYKRKNYQEIVEYSPLGSELKKQTSLAKKQYQELDEVYGLNKTVLDKKHENFKKFNITDDEFNELSDYTKYKHLQKFLKKKNKQTQEI